jgi:small GTP-binding protein
MFHLVQNLVKWASARGEMNVNILLIGLDGAGKTTLAHGLKGEQPPETIVPTMGFNFHRRDDGRRRVKFTDLGGGTAMRKLWAGYLGDAHAVVFVVDAADHARFPDAAACLADAARAGAGLAGKPLLVFANKQDLPGAASAAEVSRALGVDAAIASAGVQDHAVVAGAALPTQGGAQGCSGFYCVFDCMFVCFFVSLLFGIYFQFWRFFFFFFFFFFFVYFYVGFGERLTIEVFCYLFYFIAFIFFFPHPQISSRPIQCIQGTSFRPRGLRLAAQTDIVQLCQH